MNNVIVGAGTSALTSVAPSTSGNVLTSNGTVWASTAPAGGGFIRLGGAAFSAVTTVTISPTGFDMDYAVSTGYDVYKLFITNKNSHAGQRYYVYLAENGGSSFNHEDNNVYNYIGNGQEGTGIWESSEYSVGAFWIGGTDVETVSHADQIWHIEITMIKPLAEARSFAANVHFSYYEGGNGNGDMNGGNMSWAADGMTGVDALELTRQSSGSMTGYWTMYGLKS